MRRYIFLDSCGIIPVLALALVVSGCGSDAGTAAAITGGAFGGALVLSQVATGSKLEVTVDVYADNDDPAFQLKHKPALKRLLERMADPTIHPTPRGMATAHANLQPVMTKMSQQAGGIKGTVDRMEKTLKDPKSKYQGSWAEVFKEFRAIQNVLTKAVRLWEVFDKTFRHAGENQQIGRAELVDLASKLRALRRQLQAVEDAEVEKEYFSILKGELELQLKPLYGKGEDAEDKKNAAIAAMAKAEAIVSDDGLASLLWPISEALRAAPEGAKTEDLKWVLNNFGIGITVEYLKECKSRLDIVSALEERTSKESATTDLVRDIPDVAHEARTITFGSATSGLNVGPIRSEATQILLTGKEIDIISNEKNEPNWHCKFNKALSVGRTGNHNAVIYFRNMATPMIKTSDFDPSKFIAANGELYRKAFAATATVFGLPGVGAAEAGGVASDANLISIRTGRAIAEKDKARIGRGIANAREAAKKAKESLKQAQKKDATAKKTAIANAAQALRSAASALEASAGDND